MVQINNDYLHAPITLKRDKHPGALFSVPKTYGDVTFSKENIDYDCGDDYFVASLAPDTSHLRVGAFPDWIYDPMHSSMIIRESINSI